MNEAPAVADDRRARILDAAMSLFMEHGYARTSTLAIANRARVSKRDLYAAFPDKPAMLAACIGARAREFSAPLDLAPPASRAALEATLRAYGQGLRQGLANPQVIATYRLAVQEAGASVELARALHQEGRMGAFNALVALLRASQARGLLAAENPERMARVYFAQLVGDMILQHLLGTAPPETDAESAAQAAFATDTLLRLYAA